MGLHHQENQDLICVPTLGFSYYTYAKTSQNYLFTSEKGSIPGLPSK